MSNEEACWWKDPTARVEEIASAAGDVANRGDPSELALCLRMLVQVAERQAKDIAILEECVEGLVRMQVKP